MQIDEQMVNLSAGMAVTAEIKTGSRTILSYLLSPLLRYRQETLRERVGLRPTFKSIPDEGRRIVTFFAKLICK